MAAGSPQLVPLLTHHLSGVVTGDITEALTREARYLLNVAGPSVLPTIEDLMRLYYSGWFSNARQDAPRTAFAEQAMRLGVNFSQHRAATQTNEDRRLMYDGILDLHLPRYPEALLRHLWRYATAKGTAGNTNAADALLSRLRDKLRSAGFPLVEDQQLYIDEKEALDVQTLLLLLRMGIIGSASFQQEMVVHGLSSEDIGRVALGRLYIPTPSELLAASDRHAFDANFARRWQLDSDKPAEWDTWARRLGLDNPADTGDFGHDVTSPRDAANAAAGGGTDRAGAGPLTWGDVLWRTSQRLPSLTDLSQFLHRYRGNPNDPNTYSVPGVRPLTLDEANQFLDAMQIPNGLRTYYYHLMYDPPNKREIKSFIHTGTTNPAEVTGWLADAGMHPTIAGRAAAALFAEEAEKQAAPVKRLRDAAWAGYVRGVELAYRTGAIDRPTAESGLLSNGVPADTVQVKLDTIDLDLHTGVIQAVITRTRADWFAGRTDEIEARLRLGRSGVPDDRIDLLIATWKAQRGQGHQLAGTERVLKWYRKGFLTRSQVIQRLSNLEWDRPDGLLLLAEVEQEMKQDAAKLVASLEKGKEAQVREAEGILRGMMGNADKIMGHLRRIRPKSDVLKWYAAGRITEDEARKTLALQGYDTESIDNYLIDALDKKKGKKATKGGANGTAAKPTA